MNYTLKNFKIPLAFLSLFLIGSFLPAVTFAQNEATFFLFPSTGTYQVGSSFSIELRINTSTGITSVKTYLNFTSSIISVSSIETTNSVFGNWWENTYNNTTGRIQLQASTPAQGFTGTSGLIAKINFQATVAGTANITYDSSSLALKSDDTNALNLAGSTGASFSISAPPPPPPPPPPPDGGGGGTGEGEPEPPSEPTDKTPPAISNVRITNLTSSSAAIEWTTDEPSTSQVQYGFSQNLVLKSPLDTSFVTSHRVNLTGLALKTTFYFKVVSEDSAGNKSESLMQNFTTLSKLIGDLNDDAKVDIYDLSILLSNWKKSAAQYNLSGDDLIDIYDLSVILSNWGKKS